MATQKLYLIPNWTWRFEPNPPAARLVDWLHPKFARVVTAPPGLLNCGVLKRLNISARNSICWFSVTLNRLDSEKSQLYPAGPRRILRPALPHVPLAGIEKAAILNWFDGAS